MNDVSVGILGLGYYLPEKVLSNKDMETIVDTSADWIVDRTGIKERRIAAPEQATSDLAFIAAQRALQDANISPEQIDLIIVGTASADMVFPSVACLLQDRLKAKNAAAFDLSAGCSGFVYGLITASQMIKSGLYRYILVIGAETLSKILDWTDRNTCVLFGDGAGAVVIGCTESGYGLIGAHMGSDGSGGDLLKLPAGGSRMPASHQTVDAKLHSIVMDGNDVFKFAIKIMGEASIKALALAGLKPEDIDLLIPHQANIRIIQSAAKRLRLPMEQVFVNVDKYGNTSAASIPIALGEAAEKGLLHKGDILVLVGFGAGLTWASSVIKWCKEDHTVVK